MNAVQVSTLNIQLAEPSGISKESDGRAHGTELVQLKDQVCSDLHLPDASKLRFNSQCGMFMLMVQVQLCTLHSTADNLAELLHLLSACLLLPRCVYRHDPVQLRRSNFSRMSEPSWWRIAPKQLLRLPNRRSSWPPGKRNA